MAAALASLLIVAVGAGFVVAAKERSRLEAQAERVAAALLAEAEQGWPIEPASVPAMERWLASARAVGARREDTLAELDDLRRRLGAKVDPSILTPAREQLDRAIARREYWQYYVEKDRVDEAAGVLTPAPTDAVEMQGELTRLDESIGALERASFSLDAWTVSDPDDQLALERLQARAQSLHALANPATGRVQAVEKWIATAKALPERSIRSHRDDWDRALEAIASTASPYQGLRFEPQLGLVPLGPDPSTGLWEFWHVLSGLRPERDGSGRLMVSDDTGIVFVLVPGATLSMGAQSLDPAKPNFDPLAGTVESPVNAVRLDPFFISKFEMTQGQWLRATGENPSYMPAPSSIQSTDSRVTLAYPVQQVSWIAAARVLGNWGLELPTEAQWERAARGGTTTAYWWGERWEDGAGAVNFADQSWQRGRRLEADQSVSDDRFVLFAPVDSMRPNRFGLHHVLGNVDEWCRDWFDYYQVAPATPGSGERPTQVAMSGRVRRGGSSRDGADALRCAARSRDDAIAVSGFIGVRPARSLRAAAD